MKLGDMTFKQIAELCEKYDDCAYCPLFDDTLTEDTYCVLQNDTPCEQNLDLEVEENNEQIH